MGRIIIQFISLLFGGVSVPHINYAATQDLVGGSLISLVMVSGSSEGLSTSPMMVVVFLCQDLVLVLSCSRSCVGPLELLLFNFSSVVAVLRLGLVGL